MPLLCESPTLTPTHRRILALAFVGWMFDFYDLILYTFLVRPISAELGLTHADHSLVIGLSFVATAIGGLACGFLADRIGRKATVSYTIVLYSLGCLFTGLAGSRSLLLLARFLTGIGVGGEWAAGHALVAETFPPAHRGRAGAILQTGAPLGMGIAALVGTRLAPVIGWRCCFLASSVTALLAFITRRFMPESDLWEQGGTAPFLAGISRLLAGKESRHFYLGLLVTTVNGASYWLTYSWMPEYLQSHGLARDTSSMYFLIIVGAELTGYSIFGLLSDRFGRRPVFTGYALTMACGLLPLALLWRTTSAPPDWVAGALALVGFGTGTWSNFGPMLAELFPTAIRNSGMGAVYNLSRAAQLGAPVLVTALEPRYGLSAGIALAACCAVTASGLVWLLPETQGRRL